MKTKDGSVADHGKYVVVWLKEDGDRKLHRDIWNNATSPAHRRRRNSRFAGPRPSFVSRIATISSAARTM